MARLIKLLLTLAATLVGIVLIAAVALFLFFDPNDFRDRISVAVKEQTGRDLVISGDISLTLFPWLAVEVGETELGNAEGFSAEQMLSFDSASLSVRMMPLIFSQQVEVGSASLDGLVVNLEVDRDGRSNWDDLTEAGSSDAGPDAGSASDTGFDIAGISVTGANVSYTDARAGSAYSISDLSFETSRIASGIPVDLDSEFDFSSQPGPLAGHIAMRGTLRMSEGAAQIEMQGLNVSGTLDGIVAATTEFNFDSRALAVDTSAQTIDAGEMDLMILGLAMAADVEPFSYAGTPQPTATLSVAEFSLKELMQTLDIEPPVTADPDAMSRVSFNATAKVGTSDISLSDLTLELDDSAMTGTLSVPMDENGTLRFNLGVDAITLDGYMAPADDSVAAADDSGSDVEIPADLIRTLNVDGSFRIGQAYMTGLEFSNLQVGIVAAGGRLRMNPLSADFYDGGYSGDVRIDASGDTPSVSVDEHIEGVNLGALAKAMFDVDNINGTINGGFTLSGAGQNVSTIRSDLDGTMSMELVDGAWEGTDVWHQLRTARAMFVQEPPPEPTLPARTEFSNVRATGTVTDGIFENNDFLAELPFLQLTGAGMVDMTTSGIDYSLQVRVLERPEFMAGATAEEIEDFTETVVPLKITGSLSEPSVRPDIEGIFRARVEEAIEEKKDELRDQLLNRLLGGDEPPPEGEAADGELGEVPEGELQEGEVPPEEEEVDLEEELKKELLNRIFNN